MRKKCSFVFEERHDMHDSASCDFYVLWIGLRSGSGGVRTKNCANSGSGYAFSGRVGSQNSDPRATLAWTNRYSYHHAAVRIDRQSYYDHAVRFTR